MFDISNFLSDEFLTNTFYQKKIAYVFIFGTLPTRPRKLTPREWARLQGFPEDFNLVVADTHLYKQFGNTVSVNVIAEIAKQIKKVIE